MTDIATKTDLNELKTLFKADLNELESTLRTDMKDMESRLRTDMQDVKATSAVLEAKITAVLVQNEQTHARLDAVLEYAQGFMPLGSRVDQLEGQAETERSKNDLDRMHLRELRHEFDAHVGGA